MTTPPAAEVRAFAVPIPARTPVSAPVTIDVFFPPRIVTAVRWRVPPGPSGLMGWRLTMSGGVAVVPTGGGWIIADNESGTWPLTGQPDSGAWEVTGYNTDIYVHTVYLEFLLDLITAPAASTAQLPADVLSSPLSAGTAGVPAG